MSEGEAINNGSSSPSKYIDATVLMTLLAALLMLLGFYFEKHFLVMMGIPRSLFMPEYDVLIRKGWVIFWSLDLSVTNILTLIVVFPALFYLLLIQSINRPKRFPKVRSTLLRFRYLLVTVIALYLIDYYLPVKADNQARKVANCFASKGDHGSGVCEYFPIYEIWLSIDESNLVFYGKVIRYYNDKFVFLNCKNVTGEIIVTDQRYVTKIIRSADTDLQKSACEIPLATKRLRID